MLALYVQLKDATGLLTRRFIQSGYAFRAFGRTFCF
jgi:hypothetical protein